MKKLEAALNIIDFICKSSVFDCHTVICDTEAKILKTNFPLVPNMDLCQTDYPIDWYQEDFIPYAEEYLALPDRKPDTIINWMKKYIDPALKNFLICIVKTRSVDVIVAQSKLSSVKRFDDIDHMLDSITRLEGGTAAECSRPATLIQPPKPYPLQVHHISFGRSASVQYRLT